MVDPIPEGAIPEEQFQTPAVASQSVPPGAIPEEEFNQQHYGTPSEMVKTAIEQGLSGATLGASKVLETQGIPAAGIPPLTTPEAVAGREAANPVTATLSNIAGTGATIYGTGGIGALAKGTTALGRIGLGALEGAGIGGANQLTDDWSQNKALDAQKIAGSAGLGALLGGGGATIGEGISSALKAPLAKAPNAVENQAQSATESALHAAAPPVDAPQFKGVQPTSYQDIVDRVNAAKLNDQAIPLPAQGELEQALARVAMENPVNPLQRDSLSSQQARDIYQTAKETPGQIGGALSNYEGLQKAELVGKAGKAIDDLAPGIELTPDAVQGGKQAVDAFTEQYQNEKNALSPIFQEIKTLPVSGDILPEAITKMTEAVPGISNMFDTAGDELSIRPYRTSWGIDKATYNAVKEATQSLSQEEEPNLQTLWNVRKGLDQHVDVLTQGQAPSEIRALKAALMDQMQESSGNPEIREAFKRYAINEQQRQVIEKSFGASVGAPEFGQISKVKPEQIGDRIFGNTATVEAAKNILPQHQFKTILGNWLSEAKSAATAKGAFSSNKFGSFLKRNQDALNVAFQDNPAQLQQLRDLTTIMRILPDSPSINPSGTAKTLSRMIPDLLDAKLHNITWEGLLASIPQKVASEISNKLKMNELNQFLSGQALKTSKAAALRAHISSLSDRLDVGVKALFSGSASEARKAQ